MSSVWNFSARSSHVGRFPFCSNFRKFRFKIKWNESFRFGTAVEGGPLKPVRSFRSVGLPFDKLVVPSTALLHPAYKKNSQTRGGLGQLCATGMYRSFGQVGFPKFQTGIFVEWKVPIISWGTQ